MSGRSKRFWLIVTVSGCLALSFFAGWLVRGNYAKQSAGKSIRLGQYKLTNPLLACEAGWNEMGNLQLASFREKIEKLIGEQLKTGMVTHVSLYFSDLDNDATLEINANDGFEAASLIKMPLMMEYFKRAEHDPEILKKKITYDGKHDWNEDQDYKPQKTLEAGSAYTVDELIYRMLAYSDNNAFRLLLTDVDRNYLVRIHDNLGVEVISDPSGAKLVTVKSYAIFLRTLFNASFLNQEMSEKALLYLTADDFPQGITSTIPTGIVVASKFGERTTGLNGEVKQLHDFGIVYYPNRPYLICIMSKGSDFSKLTSVIQEISKLVFAEVDATSRKARD